VAGDDVNPSAEILQGRRRAARESLVRARSHFVDRLLASVETL
jgi:hypothetical protein